ncbi:TPA: hypothetical protein DCF80_04320 [Candidatus Saccharibacteria bacterium]|nr:hypothetical protein [Candidatus Saccharibacteria bacterium]
MNERLTPEPPLNRERIMTRLDEHGVGYPKELFDSSFTDEQIVSYLVDTLDLDSHGIGLEDLLR